MIPGDGIGPEISAAVKQIFSAAEVYIGVLHIAVSLLKYLMY
jgi:isocitrate/isopropylmalate dehydrogenase